MTFYKSFNTDEARQWALGLTEVENYRHSFLQKNANSVNRFWDIDEPLNLQLWFQSFDLSDEKNIGFCDLHQWKGNIMLDPPLKGSPSIVGLHVSERMREVFEKFELPDHKFHPLKVMKQDTLEVKSYYTFQMLYDRYKWLSYSKSRFSLIRGLDETLKRFEEGDIISYEDFEKKRNAEQLLDEYTTITVSHPVYINFFDIVWTDSNEVVFSERLKKSLEKLELKGVFFKQYKEDILFQ